MLIKKTTDRKRLALEKIAKEISVCKECLKDKVGLPVPGEGSPDAGVMFVGEAPGKQEAASGRPFIGRSGKVLRQQIARVGLKEEDVFITSGVKYLPVHVTPKPAEIEHGRKHLFEQIDIIQPKIVVLLGRVAVAAVLGRDAQIAKEHGSIVEQEGRRYLIAYHPAAAMYSPNAKGQLESDFEKLKTLLDE